MPADEDQPHEQGGVDNLVSHPFYNAMIVTAFLEVSSSSYRASEQEVVDLRGFQGRDLTYLTVMVDAIL